MGGHQTIDVRLEPAHAGWRLDRALAAAIPTLSRERLKTLIRSGAVEAQGAAIRDPATKVKGGEQLSVAVPEPVPAHNEPQDIPLTIVFEDEHLLVVDKPAGLVVHPAAGNFDGTLVNALLHHCAGKLSGIGGVARPGIVHRIDKDTSGLLVVAKTDVAHEGLAKQFAAHSIDRRYLAIVSGVPHGQRGVVDAPLARSAANRKKIAIVEGPEVAAASARSRIGSASRLLREAALLECRLETGRTHQVRVHMASIGHPLLGDPVYGRTGRTHGKLLKELGFPSPGAARGRAWLHPSGDQKQAVVRQSHASRHAGTVQRTWCIGFNALGRRPVEPSLRKGRKTTRMATKKGIVSLPSSGGEAGLNRYLAEIKKFPILSPEEEYMLAKRWREHGDTEAAAKLVNSHLRLVAKIAMGYRGYGLPVSELISEGNIGLMQGVKKFEPDRGFRVATYAMWWIRASIQEFILRSWSLVKMGTTAAQKKLFFNLRRMKNQIDAFEEGDLKPADVAKIATDLGVTEEEVVSMNRRMGDGRRHQPQRPAERRRRRRGPVAGLPRRQRPAAGRADRRG